MATKKTSKKKSALKFTNSKEEKLFPHHNVFPWRLDDKKEKKTCWFQCEEHVIKYVTRYKMTTRDYKCQFFDK
tara:strand:+ start:423 stop:641 length:219 start_codon:yes stop_codon:yes gene_type:complete